MRKASPLAELQQQQICLNSHNGGSKSKPGTILLQCLFSPVKTQAAADWTTTDHYMHHYCLAGLSSCLPFPKASQHTLHRFCQLSKSNTVQMQLLKSSIPEAKSLWKQQVQNNVYA